MLKDGHTHEALQDLNSNLFHFLLNKYCVPINGVFISPMQSSQAKSTAFVYEHVAKVSKSDAINFLVEVKYDGERLQIHYNKSRNDVIRIFSKSGRNSTQDRIAAHPYT